MSPTIWETIGLTAKEASIYELLLHRGEVLASTIIDELKLKRATAYKSLYSLENKGLISKRDVNKKIQFRPEPPDKLMAYAEQKVREQERAKEDLRTLIPDLTSAYILAVEKPVVSTFEGVEGIKKVYMDTIREGGEIKAVLQTAEVEPTIYDWLTRYYVRERVKKGVHAKVIVASGKWSEVYREKDQKELRETKLVSNTIFPCKHEVDIYGNKVAFINYKKGEALIAVVITHPQIAQTMRAWFDLAWIGADHAKLAKKTVTPDTKKEESASDSGDKLFQGNS